MKFFRSLEEINRDDYLIAEYYVESPDNLAIAAWNIAIGQSVGNPNIRNKWETEELFERHSCIVLDDQDRLKKLMAGTIKIAFPKENIDWITDGISHLLCQLMGGHVDIAVVYKCRLIGLTMPDSVKAEFYGPKYGLSGLRNIVSSMNKPLLGSIIKPKIIQKPEILLDMVKELVDGGVDFIKEDEIMSNPLFCPLEKRVDLVANYLAKQSSKIVICHTVNCDPHELVTRVKMVSELGGNGIHINVFSGLGAYNSVRKLNLPLFMHFQKSGDRLFTHKANRYSIAWPIVCQLAAIMGVDSIQTGMIGGYSDDDEAEVLESIKILREGNVTPALSCGFHPGLVEAVTEKVGNDYMINAGGAIHGHPAGTTAGARAMRQAIEKDYQTEYEAAIQAWGKVESI